MPRTLLQKVTLAALIVLLLTAGSGWLAIASIKTTSEAANYLTEHTAEEGYLSGHFEGGVFRVISEAVSFAYTRDPEFREEAYHVLDQLRNNIATLEGLDTEQGLISVHGEEQERLHEHRLAIVERLEQIVHDLFQAVADNNQLAIVQRLQSLKELEDQVEALNKEIEDLLVQDRASSIDTVNELLQRSVYGTSISFGLFAFMVVLALILLRRQIVEPIKRLSAATAVVARGDLDQNTPVTTGDEIGELQRGFNQMVSSLRDQRTAYEQRAVAEQARAAAEQANRAKSAFLANMSHELRTPLSAIIGYSELLVNTAREPAQLALLPDLQKIQQAGRHLLSLINDILDLAKIEAGKLQLALEPFDIAALIEEVVTTVEPLIAKNGNRLDVQCPNDIGSMHADPTKLRQVLLNLLGNAAKFTENGTVTLRVSSELDRTTATTQHSQLNTQNWITFEVSDTGIGMSAQQLKQLFQPFTQASAATSRLYGGTGLGLTLSRHLTRMMEGDITVTSACGQGTTFTVMLPAEVHGPAEIAAPLAATAQSSPSPEARGVTFQGSSLVLVIDDDPAARDLIARSLNSEVYTVVTASSGEEGLQLARDLVPEVIILDVLMPGMDGWTVLSSLKTDPDLVDIPVIMLTIVEEQDVGFALGASDYLIKPIESERLAALLRKYEAGSGRMPTQASGQIMIVEDDAATRELLRRTLEAAGWTVVEVATGQSALVQLTADLPNLVLVDLILPDLDGIEVIDTIRATKSGRELPIVVITGKDLSPAERERLSASVSSILAKGSCRSEELLHEAERLIRSQLYHERAQVLEEPA